MIRSKSFIATPPGATIKEQLIDRGMSQKEFAARMDMSEKHISRLINGEVQLTPDMAFRLEVVLGIPAGFWNKLESIYREKLAKVKAENSTEKDESIAELLPYEGMAGYGWVPEAANARDRVNHLRKYFELIALSELGNSRITRIACRRLTVTAKNDLTLLAWVQEAKYLARKIGTSPINMKKLENSVWRIRKLTDIDGETAYQGVRDILAGCGIALVFLPCLGDSDLKGASFTDGNKIIIGLAEGRTTDAELRFSLFHELGHVLLGHIGLENGTSEKDEKAADDWAREQLK